MSNVDNKSRVAVRSNTARFNRDFPLEYGKIPPQAIELEEIVLGELLLEKDAVSNVIDQLSEDVFYKENHQIIFNAIHELFHSNEPIDVMTVIERLKKNGKLEIVGGHYYIAQLTARVASSANIEYHVGILKQKYLQRCLISTATETIRKAYDETIDVFDLLDETERNLFEISEVNLRQKASSMSTLVSNVMHNVNHLRSNEDASTGLLTRFDVIDKITGGWQPSDLIVVAARPGMGKTSFVLSMARNIAIDFNNPVAFFSLEMTAEQLVSRLIAAESEIGVGKLRSGDLHDYEWEHINSKIQALANAPMFIDDSPGLSLFELRAKARRLKAQHDIKLIIIDYIQMMTEGGTKVSGNREQEIANISRSLKNLAKELNIPVIALSQLNRSVETRGSTGGKIAKKPVLSDLRESGAIEQDADLVLFIYRPEYYEIYEDDLGDTRGRAMISIAKHRNGKTGDVWLRFVKEFTRFENMPELPTFDNFQGHHGGGSVILQSKINDLDPNDNFLGNTNNYPEDPDF